MPRNSKVLPTLIGRSAALDNFSGSHIAQWGKAGKGGTREDVAGKGGQSQSVGKLRSQKERHRARGAHFRSTPESCRAYRVATNSPFVPTASPSPIAVWSRVLMWMRPCPARDRIRCKREDDCRDSRLFIVSSHGSDVQGILLIVHVMVVSSRAPPAHVRGSAVSM